MARRDPQHYIQARYLMGTVCAIEVYAGDLEEAEHAANSAFTAMQEVDRKMSNYREESELSQLNQRAGSGPVEVSDELFQVLSFAQRVSEASDGTFDMTVGPLLRAWGFLPANSAPATSPSGHPVVGYRHVLLSSSDRTVQYAVAGIEIDLGGIAKGYAVDRAVDALRAAEVKNARVSAGGSTIFALGAPPENALGWPHTLPSGKVIILRDQAASTSGHSEKFVESGGRRHSHIFDPRRGEPVSTEIRSVTVEAATAMESDALTKPFFILDPGGQARLREAFPGLRVRISRNTPKESAAVQ